MNPDLPPNPRAELEARVTALLLGELSAEEAASVREMIAKDPELGRLKDRLSLTLELMRETAATPVGETPAQPAPLKLSPGRREKLLAQFKTIAPKEFASPPKRKISWLVPLAAAAAVALLAVVSVPNIVKSRTASYEMGVINNLRLLDSSKQQWALEQRKSATAVPTMEDLKPYFGRGARQEAPGGPGEKYFLGPVRQPPVAVVKVGGSKKLITLPGAEMDVADFGYLLPQTARPEVQMLTPKDGADFHQLAELATARARGAGGGSVAAAGRAAQRTATFSVDSGSRNLSVIGDDGRSLADLADNAKRMAPSLPPLAAKTPIALPPGTAGNSTDVYSINGVGFVDDLAGITASEKPADTGGLTGGTGNLDAQSTSQTGGRTLAQRGSGGGGGAQSSESSADRTREAIQTAEGESAAAAPPAVTSQPQPATREVEARYQTPPFITGTIPTVGQVSGVVTFGNGAAPGANQNTTTALGVQGGTAPQTESAAASSLTRRGAEGAEREFVPQAQAAAGSTIGVPILAAAIARQPEIASTPSPNTLSSGAATVTTMNPALVAGGAAPVQFAQEGGKEESKESAQADLRTEGLDRLSETDAALPKGGVVALIPQPEVQTLSNAFSTFSLNVSDVAFKLAAASLENGAMPDAASMRSEEFINAFDYRDPEPAPSAPIGFAWERAADPFAHNRDLLRFSIKTAAQGREAGRPLNLVLLLDKSGSMERADRVEIVSQALRVLASQLQAQDTLSVVVFARTARLWVDGVPGSQAGTVANDLRSLTPEGGTNLEEAMKLAYATALRHYLAGGENRVVLMTDGAANLGNVEPETLKKEVETNRKQGISFDCFGVGWDGYNDDLLETLARAGNGRYAFINTPEEAATEFGGKLAGALRVAAADVKVQVEFNSNRVTVYRQIGYAKYQLATEQFRDNSVTAAQIGAAESGNALYAVEINPAGDGPLGTVHVRFRVPGTTDYQEHEWTVPYTGSAAPLENASAAMRLAATAGAFSEWLAGSPFAGEVTPDRLLVYFSGVTKAYGADPRPAKLEWMLRQAKSISGK